MSFDARKKKILTELLKSEKPITGETLSNIIGVSSRTIRNDIKLLNKELKIKEIKITSMPRIGYCINLHGKDIGTISNEYIEVTKSKFPVLPEDRIAYIIGKLIHNENIITLEELVNELYVSKSTIDKDLDKVQKLLNKYNLKIVNRQQEGMQIEGNELQLRYYISDYFTNMKNKENEEVYTYNTEYMEKNISEYISKIKEIILNVYEDAAVKISDIAFNNLLVHLAIAITRIKENKNISLPSNEIKNLKSKEEYKISEKIVKSLEEVFDIKVPEAEKSYITIHLLGVKALNNDKLNINEFKNVIGNELLQIMDKILCKLNEVYKIDFSKDEKLIYGLALHLKPSLNRFKYNMNFRNPLLQEIKEEYPHAFEMAIVVGNVLEQEIQIKINEDEIGYIAMHLEAAIERGKKIENKTMEKVAIICSTGIGTANLLASKIKKEFSNLIITGIHPSYKIQEALMANPDFILTTVPIDVDQVPVIHVSGLLNKKDLVKICNLIENSHKKEHKIKLYDLFEKDIYIKGIKTKDKYDTIKILSKSLLDNKYVTQEFLNDVMEREKISSTSVSNLVAIPHALFKNVINSKIAIGILDKPIKWGENMVQLVFLLAFEEMDDREFRNIFDILFSILDDRKKVDDLINTDCFEDFIKLIKKENYESN